MTSAGYSSKFAERLLRALRARLPLIAMSMALLMIVFWFFAVDYVNDDAFISFRYAENFSAGHGLVYNTGERVEGYTNFLWTVVIAGGMAIGVDPVAASRVMGLILGLAILLLVFRFGTRIARRTPTKATVAPLLLAFSAPFGIWLFSGLETPLFSFLALGGAFFFILEWQEPARFPLSAIWFALAALTRPEGVLLFSISFLAMAWRFFINRGNAFQRGGRQFLLWATMFVVIFGAHFAWRYSYYGYPLPNTFYVRQPTSWTQRLSHWERGYIYVRDFVSTNGGILFLLPAAILLASKPTRWPFYVGALVLSWAAYLVYVGGDPKVFFRLVALMLPLVYLLVQEGVHESISLIGVSTRGGTKYRLAIALSLFAIFVTLDPFLIGHQVKRYWDEAKVIEPQRTAIGRWLGHNAPPGARLAVRAAGIVPYYSGLYTYDLLGVLDPRIAHQDIRGTDRPTAHGKTDIEYILSQRPDYVMMYKIETWDEFRDIDWAEYGYDRVTLTGAASKGPHALWRLADPQP